MRAALLLAIALLAASAFAAEPPRDAKLPPITEYNAANSDIPLDPAMLDPVEKALNEIIVPEADFQQADIRDVVLFMNRHTSGTGIYIGHRFYPPSSPRRVITLAVRNAPLLYILKKTVELGDVEYRIDGGRVTVMPRP